jgi:hypothetical protein
LNDVLKFYLELNQDFMLIEILRGISGPIGAAAWEALNNPRKSES